MLLGKNNNNDFNCRFLMFLIGCTQKKKLLYNMLELVTTTKKKLLNALVVKETKKNTIIMIIWIDDPLVNDGVPVAEEQERSIVTPFSLGFKAIPQLLMKHNLK